MITESGLSPKPRVVQMPLLKSLVVILRNYASLWLRLGVPPLGDGVDDDLMPAFVEEYLATLPDELEANGVVVYHEELKDAEGTLPENLLRLWKVEDHTSRLERIEQLRKIAQSCNESDEVCESAACRNLTYFPSVHRFPTHSQPFETAFLFIEVLS